MECLEWILIPSSIRLDKITDLISRELTDLNPVRVQTNTWIRFRIEHEEGIDRVRLAFNSWMTNLFQDSDLYEIVNEMFTHMKTQIKTQHR